MDASNKRPELAMTQPRTAGRAQCKRCIRRAAKESEDCVLHVDVSHWLGGVTGNWRRGYRLMA